MLLFLSQISKRVVSNSLRGQENTSNKILADAKGVQKRGPTFQTFVFHFVRKIFIYIVCIICPIITRLNLGGKQKY
jgi:hypothetical protein